MKKPTAEDLEQTREQLRAEISEARGTLKDLRHEIKTARDLAATTRQLAVELARTQVKDVLEAEVTKQIGILGEQTSETMRKSVEKVIAEFDLLRDLLLGHERVADGREERSIPDLLQDPEILASAQRQARANHEAGRG